MGAQGIGHVNCVEAGRGILTEPLDSGREVRRELDQSTIRRTQRNWKAVQCVLAPVDHARASRSLALLETLARPLLHSTTSLPTQYRFPRSALFPQFLRWLI